MALHHAPAWLPLMQIEALPLHSVAVTYGYMWGGVATPTGAASSILTSQQVLDEVGARKNMVTYGIQLFYSRAPRADPAFDSFPHSGRARPAVSLSGSIRTAIEKRAG